MVLNLKKMNFRVSGLLKIGGYQHCNVRKHEHEIFQNFAHFEHRNATLKKWEYSLMLFKKMGFLIEIISF